MVRPRGKQRSHARGPRLHPQKGSRGTHTAIQLIRRQIGTELVIFSREDAEGQEECIRAIFENVQRIQRGSAEVEKVFNLFMRRRYGEEEPVRINLDLLTLKFLYRRNLAPSVRILPCSLTSQQ